MALTVEIYVGGARLVRLYSLGGGRASHSSSISDSNSVEDSAHGVQKYFLLTLGDDKEKLK